jgi:hypothetical protein
MSKAFLNQAQYAKHRGVSGKQVTIWKQKGLLALAPDGKSVDRDASDLALAAHGLGPVAEKTPDEIARQTVIIEGDAPHSKAEAERIKENYLALLRKIEYDRESQKVAPISEVVQAVADEYAKVRGRLLNISSRVSPRAAVLRTPEQVKALIDEEVVLALDELTLDGYDSGAVRKRFGDSPRQD